MNLTEKRIRDAKPKKAPYILRDGQVVGLGVRVFPTGRTAFILSYRVDGRERRATLAQCSEISLAEARERAGRELAAIRNGESDPLARRQEAREAPTVADMLDRYFGEYVPERQRIGLMKLRTVSDYSKMAGLTVRPSLGEMKIATVARTDIERAIAPRGKVQRNRTLLFLNRLFNIAEEWEWRDQGTNPCRFVSKAREEARDRTLTDPELVSLAEALDRAEARHPAPVAAIRTAMFTGLRISEVLAMEWAHVDFGTGAVELPDTKTGRRTHDLPPPALDVISALPHICDHVFATGDGSRGGLSYGRCQKAFRAMTVDAGLSNVTLHDLRRSLITRAAASGINSYILRDLLGHKTDQMASRYIRRLANPAREARNQIGGAIAEITGYKSKGKIVSIGIQTTGNRGT